MTTTIYIHSFDFFIVIVDSFVVLGNLTMDFGPYRLASYYYESDHIRDVTCTVNKPANVTVFFNQYMKPFDDTPSDFKTRGITINKLNGGCTYTIKFPAVSASLCHFGVYTCKAVTDTNETISKSQRVEGNFGSRSTFVAFYDLLWYYRVP